MASNLRPPLPSFDFGIETETRPDTPETRLDQWKRKLLDLTKRNRLLNLKSSKTAIRLYCSDPAALEDKLAAGKKISVIPLAKMTGDLGVSKFRIDLGIVHPDAPGRYLAGIECDGAAYHGSPSAKDRDRVRHNILENLGWSLIRIWSTDYFIDPSSTLERVDGQLRNLFTLDRAETEKRRQEAEKAAQESALPIEEIENVDEEPVDDLSAGIEKLSAQILTVPREATLSADRFYDNGYIDVIRNYSCDIIDTIGPITFRHLSEKIARAHGFQRTGTQIKSQIWAALSKARPFVKTPDGETVFWPNGMPATEFFAYRGLNVQGQKRDWRDVPYPEKLSLAIEIADGSLHKDEAASMAAKIGLGRLRQATREELETLLTVAKAKKAA